MIKILEKEDIDLIEWKELLDRSVSASFFQSKECYDLYNQLSFLKPFLIGVSENEQLKGLVCGYIISDGNCLKRFFSRRAIIPGGLLLDANISEDALKMLMKELKYQLSKKSIYIEIRNYNDYSDLKTKIQNTGFVYKPHLNFQVYTPSVDIALQKLSTTKRRDVKLSKKEGAEILLTHDPTDIKAYYELLVHLYHTRIKTPLFPYEFFEKLTKSEYAKFFIIKYKDKVIGGSTCVSFDNRTLYEWFVCGKDGEFKNVFPSTLATWAAIEYAANNGFQKFDMMGAGNPNEGYGVREFKSKFGGELVEHGRFTKINSPLFYKIGTLYIHLKKKFR